MSSPVEMVDVLVSAVLVEQLADPCWTVTRAGGGQVIAVGDPAVSHFPAPAAAAAFRAVLMESRPRSGPYAVSRLREPCHVVRCARCRAVFDEAGVYCDVEGWMFHFDCAASGVQVAAGAWTGDGRGGLLCPGCAGSVPLV